MQWVPWKSHLNHKLLLFSKGNLYPQFKDDHLFTFFVVLLLKNILKQNSMILYTFEHYVSQIAHYMLYIVEIWLLIFNIILKRLIHITVCSYNSIFLWLLQSISVYEYSAIYILVFFLMSVWIVSSLQLYDQCCYKYSCTSLSSHTNALLLYIYLGVELLSFVCLSITRWYKNAFQSHFMNLHSFRAIV